MMQQPHTHIEPDWGVDFGKPPRLELHYIEIRDEQLHVLGIVKSAIKLKDRLYRLQIPGDDEPQTLLKVRLRVQGITAYHNALNRVNTGMTASLELGGTWDGLLDHLQRQGWRCVSDEVQGWRPEDDASTPLLLTR